MGDDPYLDMIGERWDDIVMVYDTFRGKDQIIEFDVRGPEDLFLPRSRLHPESQRANTRSDRTSLCRRHETQEVLALCQRQREPTAEVIRVRCA